MTKRADPQTTGGKREEVESEGDAEKPDPDSDPDDGTGHLDDIEDGAGCTEIWERLSERREE
ncbi:hypothetical protein [Halorubrum lipolyticum]|uniref:Uncharacterized protein n=1 Tax=Halorubrum lipolyticum DSM 21995 TaxID=1227482 RepID=M0P1M3_9EURY|nr:hypothetical protein [Halorubrum lipolyticum]EMA62705.1 hypothetical protein C469_04730 [Halorubrum lipolyticum DSM 21995]